MQAETPNGPVVAGVGQVVVVQELLPSAAAAVHESTGVGPLRIGLGQVVVV